MKKYTVDEMIKMGSCFKTGCRECPFYDTDKTDDCAAIDWTQNNTDDAYDSTTSNEDSISYIKHLKKEKKLKLLDRILK